jgi:hypothetical protein
MKSPEVIRGFFIAAKAHLIIHNVLSAMPYI